jgi:hypothetical protein
VLARFRNLVLALLALGVSLLGLAGLGAIGGYLVALWLRGPDHEREPRARELAPAEVVVDPGLDPTGASPRAERRPTRSR